MPDWAGAVGAVVGLAIAAPFLYFMVVEWLALVTLGGWFSYVMVGWVVVCFGALAYYLLAEALEQLTYARLARRVIRRDTSAPES